MTILLSSSRSDRDVSVVPGTRARDHVVVARRPGTHRTRGTRSRRSGAALRAVGAPVGDAADRAAVRALRPERKCVTMVVIDEHPVFRMGLVAAAADMDGIEVVGVGSDVDDADRLLEAFGPDVLLLDVCLHGGCGPDLVRRVVAHHPGTRVVVLTSFDDHEIALAALCDGARGYLLKGVEPGRLELAIRAAAGGDVVIDRSIASRVAAAACTTEPRSPFPRLTRRELEVLSLLAEGMDNAAIARELVLSPKTVRNLVSSVLAKLAVPDRAGAIVLARRRGLGT